MMFLHDKAEQLFQKAEKLINESITRSNVNRFRKILRLSSYVHSKQQAHSMFVEAGDIYQINDEKSSKNLFILGAAYAYTKAGFVAEFLLEDSDCAIRDYTMAGNASFGHLAEISIANYTKVVHLYVKYVFIRLFREIMTLQNYSQNLLLESLKGLKIIKNLFQHFTKTY
ncbi:hypothetical protein RF11_11876 [Thelohanellus kitauei]|uniref:Uncharacterized protein n=1 Tax=Thelohanellus kitauei TaxID=669202 RepID=A0A0C2N150_THEKT|nr:hypothetical protein RF11_11876 [Thelohanellus kitauei]